MSLQSSHMRTVGLIVAGSFFMQNLDSAIINTSLPQMAVSFGVRPVDLSLGITAYILSTAAFLPISGYLADRLGSRTVFAVAIVLFTLASVACGAASTLPMFALARVAQGLGAAMMSPVGRTLVLRQAQKHEIVHAMAMITWPALIAPVLAPVLGGFITTYVSWRWNFLLNAPLGLIAIALVLAFIPKQAPQGTGPFDLKGFVLSSLALVCLLYGLERFSAGLGGWGMSVALLGLGALASIASVRHFRTTAHPLLQLEALSVPTFRISSIGAGLVVRAVISATPFLLPLLFQVGFGVSAAAAGVLIMVYFLGNLAMKTVTTATLRRFGFRSILAVNGALASLAIGLCALLSSASLSVASVAILLFAGVTRSMQFTCLNTMQFADISRAQQGPASTLSSILQQIATALGVGLGAILLQLIADLRGARGVDLPDLRLTLAIVAVAGVIAALRNLKLPRNAGEEVSGHRAGN
jgi:EmrB/QacA subfamily drug resistance transporter